MPAGLFLSTILPTGVSLVFLSETYLEPFQTYMMEPLTK